MKTKLLLLGLSLFISLSVWAQQAESLKVFDTRDNNDAPLTVKKALRVDFKKRDAVGVPGSGTYSGMLTFSPWGDKSGGPSYQLNFNQGGIYHRQGSEGQEWGSWSQLLTSGKNVFTENQFLSSVGEWGTTPIGVYGPKLFFGSSDDNTDPIWIARYNTGNNKSELHINIGDDIGGDDKLIIGNRTNGGQKFREFLTVNDAGFVGIWTGNPKNHLDVNGTIRAKEVKVESGWADFVFAEDYKLPSLDEVKAHIDEHKHLPGIPSEAEVQENGVGLSEITTKMMQKIEELTLYAIQQNETIEKLSKKIDELEKSNK